MSEKKPCDHLWLAIGFASLNAFMLAGMSLFAKLLAQYFGPIEVTFFRNAFSLVALFLWLVFARQLFVLKTQRPWAHVFRGTIGTIGIALGMWAIALMSLAETTVLLFTSPLFTLILSMIFLKECVGPYRISAIILGFAGVVVIANPLNGEASLPLLGLIVGLGWGFLSGAVDTTLRWMGSTEKASTTTFYFMLFGTLTCALHWPFAQIQPGGFSLPALLIICGLGATGLISLLAKSQSFRLGEASVVAPFMYTMIIWSVLFDYLFWKNIPTWNVIGGALIIICANLVILYREKQKGRLGKKNRESQPEA